MNWRQKTKIAIWTDLARIETDQIDGWLEHRQYYCGIRLHGCPPQFDSGTITLNQSSSSRCVSFAARRRGWSHNLLQGSSSPCDSLQTNFAENAVSQLLFTLDSSTARPQPYLPSLAFFISWSDLLPNLFHILAFTWNFMKYKRTATSLFWQNQWERNSLLFSCPPCSLYFVWVSSESHPQLNNSPVHLCVLHQPVSFCLQPS